MAGRRLPWLELAAKAGAVATGAATSATSVLLNPNESRRPPLMVQSVATKAMAMTALPAASQWVVALPPRVGAPVPLVSTAAVVSLVSVVSGAFAEVRLLSLIGSTPCSPRPWRGVLDRGFCGWCGPRVFQLVELF